jgi:hypothetical protein
VSDHTQGNWNGIVGRLELRARPAVWIESQRVFPKNDGTVRLEVLLRNAPVFEPVQGTLHASVREKRRGKTVGEGSAEFAFPRGLRPGQLARGFAQVEAQLVVRLEQPPQLWSEFNPALYEVVTSLEGNGGRYRDTAVASFGFREITTEGTRFVLNGLPLFIRGTLECAIFPKTGHPPTDVAEWRRILGVAKGHGLNNLRFHSWCPPEAAFVAADELGFYFHVEASSWANQSTTLGDGKPVDAWLYEETDRILHYYGNHPSFLLMAYGNEPGGRNHVAWLARYVNHYKAQDPRRLWTSGAGWPQIPENQWHSSPNPRIQAWGGGLKSRLNALPPETRTDYRDYITARKVPVVSHEIGQWCVYPNFAEMKKYTGYLKPRNFEIFRDTLEAHHLGDLARAFLLASGKLQTLCYKEDIESALRTEGMGGFQLLDLHDFPGQGTALVGVLDPFWEEKGYVSAREYSRFCGPTVPLARLSKRVFTQDELLEVQFDVAHFGPAPLSNVWPTFRIVAESGKVHGRGHDSLRDIQVGDQEVLAEFRYALTNLPAPARYKLVLGVARKPEDQRPLAENDWDFWVYPPQVDPTGPEGVTIVDDLNDQALAELEAGGKVLLLIPPSRVKNAAKARVALGFSSIFWNTAWTGRQPPTTLGILCDPKHPAFAEFPTDFHSNWQWWYLITRAGAMVLDDLPPRLRPTVQVIDDWVTARRLGLLFEGRIGQGSLLVCSVDLQTGLDKNPVARQLRHSLLRYMAGKKFKPAVELTAEQVRGLMTAPRGMQPRGRVAEVSSAEAGFEAENALDGDPNTFWHTAWTSGTPPFPHTIVIELARPSKVRGFTALPRQDNNRNGWIKDYAFHVSPDGRAWGEPAAQGTFANNAQLKTVELKQPVEGRFVRLTARSGHANGPWASVAEFEVLRAE